jgi:uncharacterized membrane protein YjjP (DUF1212 family)
MSQKKRQKLFPNNQTETLQLLCRTTATSRLKVDSEPTAIMKATYLVLVFGLFLTAAALAELSTTTMATLSTSFTPHVVHLDGTVHAGSGDHDGDESSG